MSSRGSDRRTARDTADEVFELLLSDRVRGAIHARVAAVLKGTLDAAIGVRHVYAKDPTPLQWTQVTDPNAIAAFLNRPDGGVSDSWTIYVMDPDVDLLRTLLAFQFGRAFAAADVPDLMQVLLEHPETGALVPLRERLQQLRAAPRQGPHVTNVPCDDNDRLH